MTVPMGVKSSWSMAILLSTVRMLREPPGSSQKSRMWYSAWH